MATPTNMLLQYGGAINQDTYNQFINGKPLDFNGHSVRLIDGDTINVDGQSIRFKGGDTYETKFNPRTKVMPSGEELAKGTKAKHVTARQLLSNATEIQPTGESNNGRILAWLNVTDPNKTVQDFKILDKNLEGGYAKVYTGRGTTQEEIQREQNLVNGISLIVNKVAQRNPAVVRLANPSATMSFKTGSDIETQVDMSNMKIMNDAEKEALKKKYEDFDSPSKYLLGIQQLVNKAIGEGIVGKVLPDSIVKKAKDAYEYNEKELKNLKDFGTQRLQGTSLLTASQVAPEVALEIGALIPIAGQVGKGMQLVGLADKLLKAGRAGKVASEAVKWGTAEVPLTYLLGEQEHLGERVAFSAAGAGAIEGIIQGAGAMASKIRGRASDIRANTDEAILDSSVPIAEVTGKNIVEDIGSRANTVKDDFVQTADFSDTNSRFMQQLNSGKYDSWSPEYSTSVSQRKSSLIDDLLSSAENANDINKLTKLNQQAKTVLQENKSMFERFGVGDANKIAEQEARIINIQKTIDDISGQIKKREEYDATHEIYDDSKHLKLIDNDLSKIKNSSFRESIKNYFNEAVNGSTSSMFKLNEIANKYNNNAIKNIVSKVQEAMEFRDKKLVTNPEPKIAQDLDALDSPKIEINAKPVDSIPATSVVENKAISEANRGAGYRHEEPNANFFDDSEYFIGSEVTKNKVGSGSGKASAFQASKNQALKKDINTIVSHLIDSVAGYVSDIAKSLYQRPHIKSAIDAGLDIAGEAKKTLSQLADKNKLTKEIKESFQAGDESLSSYARNLKSSTEDTMFSRIYNKLAAMAAFNEKNSVSIGNNIRSFLKDMMKDLPNGGKPLREAFTKHVIYTDYQAIEHLGFKSMADVRNFIKDNLAIYKQFGNEIRQAALALKDKKYMQSKYFHDNAYSIAKTKYDVPEDSLVKKIDELISAKALTEKDLNYINQYSKEPWFKEMMQMQKSFTHQSDSIFATSPQNKLKGYYKEIYNDNPYYYEFDGKGYTKILKGAMRPEYVKGALPIKSEKRGIGSKIDSKWNDDLSRKTPEELARMEEAGYKITRDIKGNPVNAHLVLSEADRVNLLRKNFDAADIISSSYQSLYKKLGNRKLVEYLKSNEGKEILKYVKQPTDGSAVVVPTGWSKLSDREIALLDRGIRPGKGQELLVPSDFKHMLIGNEAFGFTERASMQNLLHTVLRDATSHFKHQVIIANPAAYMVSFVSSITAAMREGVPFKQIIADFKEARKLYTELRKDVGELHIRQSKGLDTKAIEKKLDSNLLWKMMENGSGMTMIHDFRSFLGERSFSHSFVNDKLKILYNKMGQQKENPLWFKDLIGLEDGTRGGEIASKAMAQIDVMGRYTIVKDQLAKGKTIRQATEYADSLFGNSNKILPRVLQFVDSVPIMPFAGWAFRVFDGNVKAVKENFVESLGIYLILKSMSAMTGYNMDRGDAVTVPLAPIDTVNRFDAGRNFEQLNPFHPMPYMGTAEKLLTESNPLGLFYNKGI